jgi:thiosulfate/3-mercaptopyruvate sulfurtransferase
MRRFKILNTKLSVIFLYPVILCLLLPACDKTQKNSQSADKVEINKSDPWTTKEVITPDSLNDELVNKQNKPLVIQVGFKILYDQDHIPDAVFTGPASLPAGRAALRDSLKNINRNRNIILYCGCCKWKDCPNIRPAFKTVQELGFQNVKVLFLEDTFVKDWEQKGYPVTK